MCYVCNSRTDPTNTAGIRRKAFAEIRKRLRGIYSELRPIIERSMIKAEEVPENAVTNRRRYYYELINTVDMDRELTRMIRRWFDMNGDTPPPRWFLGMYVQSSYEAGTTIGAERLSAISSAELGELGTQQVLSSRPYFDRIARVRMRAFEEMEGFTAAMRSDLRRTLADGAARGISPRRIASQIRERISVSESRAQKIARTEIGTAFRDSRRELAEDSRDRLGLDIRLQWISALAPTTRPSHAERHLNFYTPEEVADFYAEDGNSINCLCAQQEVIITPSGDVLGQRHWTDRDRQEVDRILDQ